MQKGCSYVLVVGYHIQRQIKEKHRDIKKCFESKKISFSLTLDDSSTQLIPINNQSYLSQCFLKTAHHIDKLLVCFPTSQELCQGLASITFLQT